MLYAYAIQSEFYAGYERVKEEKQMQNNRENSVGLKNKK